jgi:hypothetical protein
MPLTRYEPAKTNIFDASNLPLHTNNPNRPVIAQPEARPSGELPDLAFISFVLTGNSYNCGGE